MEALRMARPRTIARATGNRRSKDWSGALTIVAKLEGGRPADGDNRLIVDGDVVAEAPLLTDPDEPVTLETGAGLTTAAAAVVDDMVVVAVCTEVN